MEAGVLETSISNHLNITKYLFNLCKKFGLPIRDMVNEYFSGCYSSYTTLLHVAIYDHNIEKVEFLLEKGADPTFKDSKGHDSLYQTVELLKQQDTEKFEYDWLCIMKLLLKALRDKNQ